MATGAPGTNGVWQYGEDDSEATFSALLNKAASTTDTQIGADRTRLTTLEARKLSGMVPSVPSSVAQSGGSASFNSVGYTSFTGVTSVSLNGVFTSEYDKYLIVMKMNASTASAQLRLRLRAAGTDQTGNYLWGGAIGAHTGGTQAFNGATNILALGDVSNQTSSMLANSLTMHSPQSAIRKLFYSNFMFDNGATVYGGSFGGEYQSTTQCDGFSLFLSAAGNFTGNVQVFGLND